MKINRQTVGSSQPNQRNDLQLEQQLGNQKGYARLEDALKIAEINTGADAILQGADQRFYPVKLNKNLRYGNSLRDYVTKQSTVNISGQSFQVVCFVDTHNRVLAQADHDSRLENLSSSAQIRRNLSQHVNSANAINFPEQALLQAGAPDWQDKTWPRGNLAVAQKSQVIQDFALMGIQQFRYTHGRDPSFEELPSALINAAENLPYQPTSTFEGYLNAGNDPMASWDRRNENSTEHFLKTGSGRCGDVSSFLYDSVISGAKLLGHEKAALERMVRVGTTGSGFNTTHAAIGLLPPGQYLSPRINPADIQIYDLWAHQPNPQPLIRWAEDYCFRRPVSALKNLMTPGAGAGNYQLDIFYPADHPYATGRNALAGMRDYMIQHRNFYDANQAHWD